MSSYTIARRLVHYVGNRTQSASKFVFTGAEPEFSLAAINWDHYKNKDLGSTLQTRTALSCPFRCTFCDYPVRAGKWVPQEISEVEKELQQIQARSNVTSLVFIDDTFNVPADRFKEILRMMIRNQFTFRWYSYLRCNIMDEELCDLMSKSNCAGVFLGIESGDAGGLKIMKKVATPEQYLRGMKLLNDSGIMTFASLIIGFPAKRSRVWKTRLRCYKRHGRRFSAARSGTTIRARRFTIRAESNMVLTGLAIAGGITLWTGNGVVTWS